MGQDINLALEQRIHAVSDFLERNNRAVLATLAYVALCVCFNWCRDYAMGLPGPVDGAGLELLIRQDGRTQP